MRIHSDKLSKSQKLLMVGRIGLRLTVVLYVFLTLLSGTSNAASHDLSARLPASIPSLACANDETQKEVGQNFDDAAWLAQQAPVPEWLETWLRADLRIGVINMGLWHYYGLYGHLPQSLDEFEDSGFFPIAPLEYCSGMEFEYFDVENLKLESITETALVTEIDRWEARYLVPENDSWALSDKHAEMITLQCYEDEGETKTTADYIEELSSVCDSQTVMRGAFLTFCLNLMVLDYRQRFCSMPTDSSELLDSSWVVQDSWASDIGDVDLDRNPWLVFGLDRAEEIAFAVWSDETGARYSIVYQYSPWPDYEQEYPMSYDERREVSQTNYTRTSRTHSLEAELRWNFDMDLLIWSCYLNPESELAE